MPLVGESQRDDLGFPPGTGYIAKASAADNDVKLSTIGTGDGPIWVSGTWYDNRVNCGSPTGANNVSFTVNTAVWFPFYIPAPVKISALGIFSINSNTGTGQVVLGVSSPIAATYRPGTLLASGTTTVPQGGTAIIRVSATIPAGWNFFGLSPQGANCTLSCVASSSVATPWGHDPLGPNDNGTVVNPQIGWQGNGVFSNPAVSAYSFNFSPVVYYLVA